MQKSLFFAGLVLSVMASTVYATGGLVISGGIATSAAVVTTTGTTISTTATTTSAGTATTAATSTTTAASASTVGTAQGLYTTVSCASNPAYSANSCNQCFDGGKVKVGERLTGMYDTWTNTNTSSQVMYRDEQVMPSIVSLAGGSVWNSVPADANAMWKYTNEILWTNSLSGSGKLEFTLRGGQKVKFLEADLGAGYTLVSTTAKNGDAVGLVKFPVVYHDINSANGAESAKSTHTECALYTLDAPVVTPAVVTPVKPTPTVVQTPVKPVVPKDVTKPKTGPETLLLIAAAFFIAFGLMFTMKKRA